MVAETRSRRDPGPDGKSSLLSGQALGTKLWHLLFWKLYLIAMARIQVTSEIVRFDRLATVWGTVVGTKDFNSQQRHLPEIAGYSPVWVPQMTSKRFTT